MTYNSRLAVILAVALAFCGSLLLIDPIPQDPAYHLFADGRGCLGIPNVANVASNIGFILVGLMGLFTLFARGGVAVPGNWADRLPYVVFFAGIALIGAGSAYYHWRPDNQTLFWDRLPITIAFMAFTAAVIADRVHRTAGLKFFLPALVLLGPASLVYWSVTEAAGRGDLRFYGLVQFLPILLIPLICWLFPRARYTRGSFIAAMLASYALAKIFEGLDGEIYMLAGEWISGHTLKHLAATVAAAFVIPMLWRARASTDQTVS